jgi:hypothetical protein
MRGIEIFLMMTEWPLTPDDRGGVHEGAVDDGLGRERLHAEALQRVDDLAAPAVLFQRDELDPGRTDVEPQCQFAFRHRVAAPSLLSGVSSKA